MTKLDLSGAPDDPLSRLVWLDGVRTQVRTELDDAFAVAYYEARLQGLFEPALDLGLHGKHQALKFTRQVNNSRHRMIRWGDRIDPHSTQFEG